MNFDIYTIQWIVLVAFGLLFFFLAPFSKTKTQFFKAEKTTGQNPSFWILTSSLVISWIFAKSITNAANLGLSYGIVGGFGYAAYYLSFLVAGIIIFRLRTKGGYNSIHHFLQSKYGKVAVLTFSFLIIIRLFNEVWSNSMIIGNYFGNQGSYPYYIAIIVFTLLTLAYVLKGGLRSSLLTDFIQMLFFGVLLIVLLGIILPKTNHSVTDYVQSGTWELSSGVNLILVALLQVFSYPFHDPVLTDRAFIASPKRTLKSFIVATIIGFVCILLFSLIGVFAKFNNLQGDAAVEVGKLLGIIPMLLINVIMITSAASTIDSTFSSFSKLIAIDMFPQKGNTIKIGRLSMIVVAIAGTVPIFLNPEILSATTISGTMVMGLAPVFVSWKVNAPKISFHLSIWFGVALGVLLAVGAYPKSLEFSQGKYADLLSVNLVGLIICFILFYIPVFVKNWKIKTQ